MKNDMRAVNAQLVHTSSTAIRNSTILENKLSKAKTSIDEQAQTIEEQTALIEILETRSTKVESVLNLIQSVTIDECVEKVKTLACKQIEKYISEYIKEEGSISLTSVKGEITEAENRMNALNKNVNNI